MMDYYNLDAVVPSLEAPYPISNIIEITDSVQSAIGHCFALIDWLTCPVQCLFL